MTPEDIADIDAAHREAEDDYLQHLCLNASEVEALEYQLGRKLTGEEIDRIVNKELRSINHTSDLMNSESLLEENKKYCAEMWNVYRSDLDS
jgi:hypothetical protein